MAVEVKCISSTEDKKGLEEKMFGAFKVTARKQLGLEGGEGAEHLG